MFEEVLLEHILKCFYHWNILDMKRFIGILSLLMVLSSGPIFAQVAGGKNQSIFDALQESGNGGGTVVVHQSDALRKMVGERFQGANVETADTVSYIKMQGFRIQIYSGNDQRKSKDEAFLKEREVKEMFPDLPTYVTYKAPFWNLRVGDFRTHEEARRIQRQLMDAFPNYKRQMYILRGEIRIPMNN